MAWLLGCFAGCDIAAVSMPPIEGGVRSHCGRADSCAIRLRTQHQARHHLNFLPAALVSCSSIRGAASRMTRREAWRSTLVERSV